MSETLADLEVLALHCRSEQSREYISEALLCYRSSAYRAAIVSTWIAVVFDLIDKIRELALSGDADAANLEAQYEKYLQQIEQGNEQGVKGALQFERDVLGACKERLQLFDQQQFTDLSRLREDRHRCAHPSFQKVGEPYRPSAEQARLHLRNAILHVLAQPPVQGRAALAELTVLVSSAYFPTDTTKAVLHLKSSAFGKASDALVRGFVDQMVFGFFNENGKLYHKRQAASAINASLEMYRALTEPRLAKQLGKVIRDQPDAEFPFAAAFVSLVSTSWDFLDGPARDKLVDFTLRADGPVVIKVLSSLAKIDELRTEVAARVGRLTLEELAEAIGTYRLRDVAKNRSIELLSEARSWDSTNQIIDKAVLPLFEFLDRPDIERIIRLPVETRADLIHAASYGVLIERVRQAGTFTQDELNQLLRNNRAEYLVAVV